MDITLEQVYAIFGPDLARLALLERQINLVRAENERLKDEVKALTQQASDVEPEEKSDG